MLAGRAYLTPAAPADWKYLRVAQVTGNPGVLPIPESQPTKNCHEYLDGRAVNLDATLKRQQRTQYLDAVAALGRARTVKRLIQEGSFESQQLRNASTLPQVLEEDEEPIKNGISGKRTHPSGCYSEAKPIIALADPGKAQNRRPSHGLKPRSRSTSLASITSEAVYGIFVDMDDAGVKKGAYTTGLIPLSSPSVPNMSSSSSSIKGKEKEVSSMDDMTVQGSLFSEQLRNAMSDSVSFQESFLSYPEYLEEPYMDNNFRHSSVYTFQEHDNHTSSLHRTTSAPAGASFAFQPSADTATTSSSNLLDNPRRGSSIYRRSALHGDTPLDIQTTHVTSGYTVIFGEHTSSMSVSDLRASTLLRDLAARHALESPRKLKKSESCKVG
ncbi:hypothetical protein BZG36_00536 [Bifiguratus adelaidae]|uniref:Uncharacterized protein n=1 Tax=Bifiguratus adelaidae TaxID=1938954 RepID=A0A261Y752_9FUNG|nr:hypothetical protein BZG36_00536 [Bifiguratus adelaidae]